MKGRTPPIEGKKKIKAILATDHFSAFKYPTSNKSMREEGVRLYTSLAHLFKLTQEGRAMKTQT